MMRTGYKAILFSMDGDYVTDYRAPTVDEVIERLANRSTWYFYPIDAVIRDLGPVRETQRIVDGPNLGLRGRTIRRVSRYLAGLTEDERRAFLEVW